MAEELENAALDGNHEFVIANNENLVEKALKLISDINLLLEEISSDNQKHIKERPDKGTLIKLRTACENYDMSSIDAALEELEASDYKIDGDLIIWLRENTEQMNLDEIVKKLSAVTG